MTTPRFASDASALVARITLAALFVPAGFAKIGGFAGTAGYIASKGLPLPELGAALAVAIELGGGLLLLAGLGTRWAALALAVFVAALTPIFHPYWAADAAQVMQQQLQFFKNLGLVGGLAMLAGFGGGRFSVETLVRANEVRRAPRVARA